jgi:hypothetical protein
MNAATNETKTQTRSIKKIHFPTGVCIFSPRPNEPNPGTKKTVVVHPKESHRQNDLFVTFPRSVMPHVPICTGGTVRYGNQSMYCS